MELKGVRVAVRRFRVTVRVRAVRSENMLYTSRGPRLYLLTDRPRNKTSILRPEYALLTRPRDRSPFDTGQGKGS